MKSNIPESFSFDISRSTVPLYRQIYEQLKTAILSQQLAPGTKLPASRELATRLQVSRNTVTNAYEKLWSEGFVEGQIGAGTYVAHIDFTTLQTTNFNEKNDQRPLLSQRGEKIFACAKKDYIAKPETFTPGIPDIKAFRKDVWARILSRQARYHIEDLFAYDSPAGYAPLRTVVCQYLRAYRGVKCDTEQVVIISGAQQGLDLIARFLIDPHENVAMENPGYLGARNAFFAAQAQIIPVDVDAAGLKIDDLQRQRDVRLLYLTPSHQYPLGMTLSLERRIQILQWARQQNAWIIEDDYDSEYRYAGQPIAAMQGIDNSDRVLYLGTFSKVLFPGLRIGYMVVPKALVPVFSLAKSICDHNCSTLLQAALASFIEAGHFNSHLRRTRILYKEKQQYFLQVFAHKLSKYCTIEPSATGMHLVAFYNGDDREITKEAVRHNLVLRPLSSYYLQNPRSGFVLGYAGYTLPQIYEGICTLEKIFTRKN
ncbi:PLP-dependent aminotransferase family protein [Candidatus Uabimicrobium amorphum]|uniref:GntR family transcriptional regulator n=1 Tax=Uabimicrobium amorphum TaxID=2596890 RepID=A0A5S9IVK2_UABAM|nr:PLP-dependent aminotransferase family protein [Candidatus Uabimicrobium amorphum]BBM87355.1 GntR family transcriptional regulator [Candidatus Uabimicrobium amorphum]